MRKYPTWISSIIFYIIHSCVTSAGWYRKPKAACARSSSGLGAWWQTWRKQRRNKKPLPNWIHFDSFDWATIGLRSLQQETWSNSFTTLHLGVNAKPKYLLHLDLSWVEYVESNVDTFSRLHPVTSCCRPELIILVRVWTRQFPSWRCLMI